MFVRSSGTSSRKRKRLPSLGLKLNHSENPEKELLEIQSFLQQQKELLEEPKIEKDRLLIYADWDDSIFKAKVTKNSGSSLEVFGHNRGGCVYLHPEEALYLIEMNKLQLFYNKIRLSVQRSYGVLLKPACNISIHHYRVYKHFVIQGYKLFRHEIFHKSTVPKETKELKTLSSYGEYLQKLQIFESLKEDDFKETNLPQISYDVFLPNFVVKKSCRPEPDYYLIVLSAKEKIWDLMHLVSQTNKTNILFASAEGNSISVFNLQGVQIPILD
ncbi:hypothetical protein V9T40_008781 [Parthenolecanium corni]|uniref:tRNA-splicing endonuclease subunit Sen54 N-terminal domain-containing protein n=1 Tax=Parthenolecanium corni TaxID=536013 RepID=A0AAN9Y8G1_9HEMI